MCELPVVVGWVVVVSGDNVETVPKSVEQQNESADTDSVYYLMQMLDKQIYKIIYFTQLELSKHSWIEMTTV